VAPVAIGTTEHNEAALITQNSRKILVLVRLCVGAKLVVSVNFNFQLRGGRQHVRGQSGGPWDQQQSVSGRQATEWKLLHEIGRR
jgi:hypothetical protein